MAGSACVEGPRQLLNVPTPYGSKHATGKCLLGHAATVKEDTIKAVCCPCSFACMLLPPAVHHSHRMCGVTQLKDKLGQFKSRAHCLASW